MLFECGALHLSLCDALVGVGWVEFGSRDLQLGHKQVAAHQHRLLLQAQAMLTRVYLGEYSKLHPHALLVPSPSCCIRLPHTHRCC
jgi:hypothetical protein